jgi:hypothetical protein
MRTPLVSEVFTTEYATQSLSNKLLEKHWNFEVQKMPLDDVQTL